MSKDTISYNRATARELGWNPGWFGKTQFNADLVRAIVTWQTARGLEADGRVGRTTFDKLIQERRVNVISFNKATARELGWHPNWFGATQFDWNLVLGIKRWQTTRGLFVDGKVGPTVYRIIQEERRARGLDPGAGISREVLYNRASEAKIEWKPSWFGAERNDEALVAKVYRWQKRVGLKPDGMVGNGSYRRLLAQREAASPVTTRTVVQPRSNRSIIFNGKPFPVEWDKVVLWNEEGGLKAKKNTFRWRGNRANRDIKCFVNHWDVTTSARKCAQSFDQTGLSVHFCIDNDGTIYQMVDMQHVAWQAKGLNFESVGVEISNAFYLRYQDQYVRKGHGARPIWSGKTVHGGTLEDFLGFYPGQIDALKALWKAVHLATGIPLATPTVNGGKMLETVDPRITKKTYRGFISHFQLTTNKIDSAGLDLVRLIKQVKSELGQ